ncbi:uncharacterized protein LOC124553904 [Schistocerca americana]|uniref:uncharacterized protein LOC124553904 n=1 Tax=Schistocerca americana TaxID=7009 RepID=UPI001F4FABAC|nr:uncharacterized protein LOC124553904 [Schistocerca americana]
MQAAGVVAALAALLAGNGTSVLDCVCSRTTAVARSGGILDLSDGEIETWWDYCLRSDRLPEFVSCGALEQQPAAWSAVVRTADAISGYGLAPPAGAGEEGEVCADALAELRRLTRNESLQLVGELICRMADDCINSCSVPRLDNMAWNTTTLQADGLRHHALSQTWHAVRRITRAMVGRKSCEINYGPTYEWKDLNKTGLQAQAALYRERLSNYWRDLSQLLSLSATHFSQLFVPLAFEHMGNRTSDQQLHGWIKDVQRVKGMLHTKLTGLVHDMQYASKEIGHFEVEEDKEKPGRLILRRPLLSEQLLHHQPWNVSFHDDFSALCEQRQPEASQMFSLAATLYASYRVYWYTAAVFMDRSYEFSFKPVDEEWQLEDRSNTTLSVDTDCVQLLMNALDNPTCPLDDLPVEAVSQRLQCRAQLWDDMVQRSPHIPVTSYLAYTQRVNVNLCLLAWMAVNSFGICQDVPFSIMQSVHDARCYFDSPDDQSCLQSNATDAICSVSRAVLLLKCHDFFFFKPSNSCRVLFYLFRDVPLTYSMLTEQSLAYKATLNNATLRYKDFKIDSLKYLEISLIVINIIFRFSTAGVYMYLPQLRNLPGKIFLSFQITGIIQVLCSEVVYRMAGVPDLPTAVLIDGALTLLSCIWLNIFCYEMYACVRHLRLPNDILPAELSQLFCRQVLLALIPWSTVCVAAVALEKTSRYYLIHSRIVVLVGISMSVTFNLVCLGLVGYMYLRTRYFMRRLKIVGNNKFASKKQCLFMSVKAVILSGLGIIIRIGFHQAQGVAQFVYYVHLGTMVQGPVLFVCFICNGTTLPALKDRILAWWSPTSVPAGQELCSAAERNLARRNNEQPVVTESSL